MPSLRRTAIRWLTSRRAGRWSRRALPFSLLTLAFTAISWSAFAASNDLPDTSAGQSVPALATSPAIVSIASANGELDVVFDPPGNEPSANITTYQYSTDDGLTWKARSVAATTSPLAITTLSATSGPLINGIEYSIRIRAINAIGTGAASNRVDATPYTVAIAPGSLGASEDDGLIAVSWQAPLDNGGNPVSGFRVQVRTSPDGTWTDPAGSCAFETTGTSATLSCDATGLTNGTAYNVRVAAINAGGTGTYSAPTGDVTPTAPASDAPGALVAVAGNEQATLNWTAPTEPGNPISGYTVTSSPGGYTCTTSGELTCAVTGLTNGTAYTFSAVANSVSGNSATSNPSAAVTPCTTPGTPTSLEATPGESAMTLSWTAPTSNGGVALTDYTVQYRELNAPTWTTLADATSTVTTATVTGLTVGTTYEFRVAALNAVGSGSYTAAVSGDGSTAWGPEDLSGGLGLWLDADDAATLTLSGAALAEWSDKSGHLRHGTQATSANQPAHLATVMNSRGAVVFDGVDDTVPFDGSFALNSDYTAAAALARSSNQSNNYFLGGTTLSANANLALGWNTDTALAHAHYLNDYELAVSGYSGSSVDQVLTFRHSSTEGKSTWIDGGASTGSSNDTTSLSAWAGSSLGRHASSYFGGRVGEVVMVTSALATGEREKLEGYLAWKWGTTALLASNHPYKDLPPYTSTPATAPGEASGLSATASDQSVTLSWTAPSFDGDSALADYVVQYRLSGDGSWTTFNDGSSTATSATVSGLANGVTYDVQVAAVNAAGTGSYCTFTSATTLDRPAAPSSPTATAGELDMTLSWSTPASDGGAAITDYVVQYQVTGAGSWSTFSDGSSTATTATLTGLTLGTGYDFQVAAVNSVGPGPYSCTVTGSGSTAWGPEDLSGGLGLWLDADDADTLWLTGSSLVIWVDKSGKARPAYQGVWSGYYPTLSANAINGRSAVTFDGINDYLDFDGSFLANTDYTIAAVATRTSNKANNYLMAGSTTTANTNLLVGWSTNAQFQMRHYGAGNADVTVDAFSSETPLLSVVQHSSTDAKAAWLDGGTLSATSASTVALSSYSTARLGYSSQTSSSYFQGRMGELVVAASALSTSDRQLLEGYLAWKWATTASLPANHPYKATAPYTSRPATVAGAPTALAATGASGSVSLTWTAPASNGATGIADYAVAYKLSSASSWATFSDGVSTTAAATVSGLTAGSSYDFKVQAINAVGYGSYSSVVSSLAATIPNAPTALSPSAAALTTATLTWTAPTNGGSSITDYVVQYRINGASSWSTFADGTSATAAATVTGLTAYTTYDFQVAATNAVGTGSYASTTMYHWNPDYLTPAVWLDADDSSTFTLVGSAVSQWNDKSGNSRDVSQAIASQKPVRTAAVMGGRNAVVFDGTNDFLTFPSITAFTSSNYTVASAVARYDNRNANGYLGGSGATNGANLMMGWSASAYLTSTVYGVDAYSLDMSVGAYSTTTDEVHTATVTNSGWALYLNGGATQETKANTQRSTGWAGAAVGRATDRNVHGSNATGYFYGRVGEIVMFTSALSTADRQLVEGYLAWKWGTTSALPSTHPYKSTLPTTTVSS